MLIRHFMSRDVTTFPAEMLCTEAWKRFQDESLRRVPVLRGKRVVGMVTDRDLMRVLPWRIGELEHVAGSDSLSMVLGQILPHELVSVSPDAHLETAAHAMLSHKIGGLPVIDGGELVGIITESDLFRVFVKLKDSLGGVRLTLHWSGPEEDAPDPARLALASGIAIREYFQHPSPEGGNFFALRVDGAGVDQFQERLTGAGFLLIDREDQEGA